VNNSFHVKENGSRPLAFAFYVYRLFGLGEFGIFYSDARVRLILSSPKAPLFTPGYSLQFSEIRTIFDVQSLSDPSRNHIRPDTRLLIERRKKSARPPSCVKF
jgi:hypothetical protein